MRNRFSFKIKGIYIMSDTEHSHHAFEVQQTDHFDQVPPPQSTKASMKNKILFVIMLFFIISIFLIFNAARSQVSCIFITHGSIFFVKKTIKTFQEMNTLEMFKTIIVYDGQNSDELDDLMEDYELNKAYEFIVTGSHKGEIYNLDLAINRIQTPYFFLSLGLWNYTKKGFIQKAYHLLQNNKKVSQVAVKQPEGVFNLNISLLETAAAGFSLAPSLHRLNNYKMLQKSYTEFSRNVSYNKSVGDLESLISSFYLQRGLNIMSLNQSYAQKFQNAINLYKPYRYQTRFQYRRFWDIQPQQKDQCVISLQIDKCKVRQHRLKRQTKKEVSQQIKINASEIDRGLLEYGIAQAIQIESPFDRLKIKSKKKYDNVSYYYGKSLYFKQSRYEGDRKSQPEKQKLNFQNNRTLDEVKKQLKNLNLKKPLQEDNQLMKMGVGLLQNPKNSTMAEIEYLYYSNLYNTGQFYNQLSICIFIEGYNLFSRTSFHSILGSINNQNYSNFKIVIAADEDEDSSAGHFYEYFNYFYPKLMNRFVAALTNQDKLGTAGNHYMFVKNYCKGSDIVLTLNGNSSLVGQQAFKLINTMYQDEDTWMILFRPIQQDQKSYYMKSVPKSSAGLRNQGFNTDIFLVTYRYQLATYLPFEYVVQFLYDNHTNYIKPSFYQTQSNVFHTYAFMEMSGEARVKFSQVPIYYYKNLSPNQIQCFSEKELFTQAKASLKYQLSQLNSILENPKINYTSPKPTIQLSQRLKQTYKNYQNCLNSTTTSDLKRNLNPSALSISQQIKNALSKMKSPNFYFTDMDINLTSGLPFCFILPAEIKEYAKIIQSIKYQSYENTRIIVTKEKAHQIDFKKLKQSVLSKGENIFQVQNKDQSYQAYRSLAQQFCEENSIIMFVDKPLKWGILQKLNEIYQFQNVWMTYSVTSQYVQIHSFYLRIFQLLQSNDYHHTNMPYFLKNNQQVQCLAMLELCPKFSYKLNIAQVYSHENSEIGYFRAFLNDPNIVRRHPYDHLLTLSQDYFIDVASYENKLRRFQKGQDYQSAPGRNTLLNKNDLMIAVEYQQLPYLPKNHYLNFRQIEHLNKVYEIDKYSTGQYKQKEVSFCVTVYGRNNTQNNRYANILKTLLMQNYTNYHIVFIDDVSDDTTLEDSIEYIRKSNFPKQRIKFIKNIQRRYATYNIINSAFNFCGADDVQVRIDGDDIIIGRQVLRLFNAFYQKYPEAWVIYSNFKSSFYTFGLASEIRNDVEMLNCAGGRRRFHFIAPLTTWRIKLIRSIPLKNHQLQHGDWLNTLYDDALQFAFRELATVSRIKYIPYITYGYNTGYGSNDNSDMEKIKDRISVFEYVVYTDSLPTLSHLNQRYQNPEVAGVLKKDEGKMYKTVQI